MDSGVEVGAGEGARMMVEQDGAEGEETMGSSTKSKERARGPSSSLTATLSTTAA